MNHPAPAATGQPAGLAPTLPLKGGNPMPQTAPDRRVEPLAYTVEEAAEATRLSRDLLYDEMRAGRLAYLKVGRRRIITRQHLDAFLTQRASKPPSTTPPAARARRNPCAPALAPCVRREAGHMCKLSERRPRERCGDDVDDICAGGGQGRPPQRAD